MEPYQPCGWLGINEGTGLIISMDSENETEEPKPVLEAKVQAELGKKLQQVYSDVISEPVPDRFLNLLDQLDDSTKSSE